jgi:hypothetical protein
MLVVQKLEMKHWLYNWKRARLSTDIVSLKYVWRCLRISAVDLQAGRSRDRVPMRRIFSNLPPSSRTMALGSTQPLTEMSTKHLKKKPVGKILPARRADNLAAIC